jgi:hypothetical protein
MALISQTTPSDIFVNLKIFTKKALITRVSGPHAAEERETCSQTEQLRRDGPKNHLRPLKIYKKISLTFN